MTSRELLTAIVNGSELNADHIAKAQEMLNALSKERKPSKAELEKQAVNEALKAEILNLLATKGGMIASAIAECLSTEDNAISTSKASALCRQLVADEKASVEDVKIPKKGTVKQYSIVITSSEE